MIDLNKITKYEDIDFDKLTVDDFDSYTKAELVDLIINLGKIFQDVVKGCNKSNANFDDLLNMYANMRDNYKTVAPYYFAYIDGITLPFGLTLISNKSIEKHCNDIKG